jgi:hypothetical protein
MQTFKRYAVYFAPRPGPFAKVANAWLGWDPDLGQPIAQPAPQGLPRRVADLTSDPAKYGFHGTIRAPFRPGEGVGVDQIKAAVADIAAAYAPVVCDGLQVENLHGFLALTPMGDLGPLRALAEGVVRGTNGLRAPLTPTEVAKRRPESLSPRQRDLLEAWGYPFVMEEFYFHLTLTGRLQGTEADTVQPILAAHFAPHLPRPFVVQDLCLYGEDNAGRFHLLHRYPLSA